MLKDITEVTEEDFIAEALEATEVDRQENKQLEVEEITELMATDFLPDNYSVPDKANGYMKFKLGENRVRILASPIIGYEWWVDEGDKRKPIRVRIGEAIPVEQADNIKHFWAMPVWNYESKQIQILEVTQKGIQKTIATLAKNTKWGTPVNFDILIEKTGEGLDTEYSVTPEPKEPLEESIKKAFADANINLEALYDGGDPFAK